MSRRYDDELDVDLPDFESSNNRELNEDSADNEQEQAQGGNKNQPSFSRAKTDGKGRKFRQVAGKPLKGAGKGMKGTGKAMKGAGKGIKGAGNVADKGGKGISAAGKGASVSGKGMQAAGVGLQAIPVVGTAVGAVVGGVGKGVDVAGKGMDIAGRGISLGGKGLQTAGKGLEKGGKGLENAGNKVDDLGSKISGSNGTKEGFKKIKKVFSVIMSLLTVIPIVFIIIFAVISMNLITSIIDKLSFEKASGTVALATSMLIEEDEKFKNKAIVDMTDDEFKKYLEQIEKIVNDEVDYIEITEEMDEKEVKKAEEYNLQLEKVKENNDVVLAEEVNRIKEYMKAERKSILEAPDSAGWLEKLFSDEDTVFEARLKFIDAEEKVIDTGDILVDDNFFGRDYNIKEVKDDHLPVNVEVENEMEGGFDSRNKNGIESISEEVVYNMVKPHTLKWQTLYFFERLLDFENEVELYKGVTKEDGSIEYNDSDDPVDEDKEDAQKNAVLSMINKWMPKFTIQKFELTNVVEEQIYVYEESSDPDSPPNVVQKFSGTVTTITPVFVLVEADLWNKKVTKNVNKETKSETFDYRDENGAGEVGIINEQYLKIQNETKYKDKDLLELEMFRKSDIKTVNIEKTLDTIDDKDKIFNPIKREIAQTFGIELKNKVFDGSGSLVIELYGLTEEQLYYGGEKIEPIESAFNFENISEVEEIINQVLADYSDKIDNLDVNFVKAMIAQESSFNKGSTSDKNAQGYMQVIPDTFKYVMQKVGLTGNEDPYDPYYNILAGCLYLSEMLHKFEDDEDTIRKAIAGYNAGSEAIPDNVEDIPDDEVYGQTRGHIKFVLGYYLAYSEDVVLGSGSYEKKEGGYSNNSVLKGYIYMLTAGDNLQRINSSGEIITTPGVGGTGEPVDLSEIQIDLGEGVFSNEILDENGQVDQEKINALSTEQKRALITGLMKSLEGSLNYSNDSEGIYQKYRYNIFKGDKRAGDCSSVLQALYQQIGIEIGANTWEQYAYGESDGKRVYNEEDFKPGDLVVCREGRHVEMYMGEGMVMGHGGPFWEDIGPNLRSIHVFPGFKVYNLLGD